MRPHASPSRAATTRRLRAQLREHLHWVDGWPLAVDDGQVRLQIVPPPGHRPPSVALVDRPTIARASRCWTRSTRRFRTLFRHAVADPDAFKAVVPQRLRQVSRWLDGAPLPGVTLEGCLTRATAVHPERDALHQWFRAHQRWLHSLQDPVLAIQLVWLARDCPEGVALLRDRWDLVRHPDRITLANRLSGASGAEPSPEALSGVLEKWVGTIYALKAAVRNRAFGWLAQVLSDEVADTHRATWASYQWAADCVANARASHPDDPRRADLHKLATDTVKAVPAPPPAILPPTLHACIDLASHDLEPLAGIRHADITRWAQAAEEGGLTLLRAMRRDLAADPDLWDTVRNPEARRCRLEHELLDAAAPVAAWRVLEQATRAMGGPIEPEQVVALVAIDPTRAAARAVALENADIAYAARSGLRLAHRTSTDPAGFARIVKLVEDDNRYRPFFDALGRDSLRVLDACGARSARLYAAMVALLQAEGHEPPTWEVLEGSLQQGWQRYPRPLHAALRKVAGTHPTPDAAIRKILDRDLPSEARIASQIEALRGRTDERARARVTHLQQRLLTPSTPGPGRLANLAAKLERVALLAAVRRWDEALRGAVAPLLAPEDPDDEKLLRIRGGLARLSPDFRALGKQLLDLRSAPPPWRLPDTTPVRTWRADMTARGLTLDAWDDPPQAFLAHPEGDLRVVPARDPVDVLWMGAPWNTCLAPGDINFFSAVTNAADPDKLVVYVVRGDEVIARCLFAITTTGVLQTYRAYGADAFLRAVLAAYAQQLAGSMGTIVSTGGSVTHRVASNWYDDGSIDFTGQLNFMNTLHETVGSEDVEGFRAALDRHIAHAAIPPLVPALLHHHRMTDHWVLGIPGLENQSRWTRCRAAIRLLEAGRPDLAWRLAGDAVRHHGAELAQMRDYGAGLLRLWADHDPVAVHRVLKDASDAWPGRRVLWAEVLEQLHRPKQAAEVRGELQPGSPNSFTIGE